MQVLRRSRSGYYDYLSRMDIPAKDLALTEKIQEYQDKCDKTYGYCRVHIWLERQGIHYNPKIILRCYAEIQPAFGRETKEIP